MFDVEKGTYSIVLLFFYNQSGIVLLLYILLKQIIFSVNTFKFSLKNKTFFNVALSEGSRLTTENAWRQKSNLNPLSK